MGTSGVSASITHTRCNRGPAGVLAGKVRFVVWAWLLYSFAGLVEMLHAKCDAVFGFARLSSANANLKAIYIQNNPFGLEGGLKLMSGVSSSPVNLPEMHVEGCNFFPQAALGSTKGRTVFNQDDPNGHYLLDLSKPQEYQVRFWNFPLSTSIASVDFQHRKVPPVMRTDEDIGQARYREYFVRAQISSSLSYFCYEGCTWIIFASRYKREREFDTNTAWTDSMFSYSWLGDLLYCFLGFVETYCGATTLSALVIPTVVR